MYTLKNYLYLSASFLALFSSAHAMEAEDPFQEGEKKPRIPSSSPSKRNSDWETNPEISSESQRNSSIEEEKKQLQKDFIQAIQGNPSTKANPKVGKIRIPSGLLGIPKGEDVFISVPQNPEIHESKNDIGDEGAKALAARSTLVSLNLDSSERQDNNNPSGVSKVVLEKEESKAASQPASRQPFEERVQRKSFQQNTFQVLGLPENEDNLASYFFTEEALYDRLFYNFHGPDLMLNKASLHLNPKSPLIFDALVHTKSVKNLSLVEAQMNDTNYFALMNALARNQSLKRIDFTKASFTENSLTLLGLCLKDHKTLQELILRPTFTFTEKHIESFYESIKNNQGLRLIVWPDDLKILKKIRTLADKGNRVAALHVGFMHATGILLSKDLKEAMKYLQKAYDLGHPLASYEIGHLKEKQNLHPEALEWFQKAADKGHPKALTKMGDYHRAIWPKGTEKQPDYQKAHQQYKLAVEKNHPKALYRLGRMYEAGKFVAKDLDMAGYHFYQALEWGYPDAFAALGALYNNPEYSGYDPTTAKYYLEWGQRYPKVEGMAQRILSYMKP